MTSIAPKRAAYHHGNLRAALVDAALHVVEQQGAEALRLRALAELLGVAHAALYRHFSDRAALFAALLERGYRDLAESFASIVEPDPASQLRAIGQRYACFAFARPRLFLAMTGPQVELLERADPLNDAIEAAFTPIAAAIVRGSAAGMFDLVDARSLSVFFWSGLQGVLVQLIHRRIGVAPDQQDAYVRQIVDRLIAGLSLTR